MGVAYLFCVFCVLFAYFFAYTAHFSAYFAYFSAYSAYKEVGCSYSAYSFAYLLRISVSILRIFCVFCVFIFMFCVFLCVFCILFCVFCIFFHMFYPFWSLISIRHWAVKHEGFRHCSCVVVAREVGGCRLNKDSFVNFRTEAGWGDWMPLLSVPGWKASDARQHLKLSQGCSAPATSAPNGGGTPQIAGEQ